MNVLSKEERRRREDITQMAKRFLRRNPGIYFSAREIAQQINVTPEFFVEVISASFLYKRGSRGLYSYRNGRGYFWTAKMDQLREERSIVRNAIKRYQARLTEIEELLSPKKGRSHLARAK